MKDWKDFSVCLFHFWVILGTECISNPAQVTKTSIFSFLKNENNRQKYKKMVWRLLWLLPIFFIYTHLTPVSFKDGSEKSVDSEELPPTAWIHSSWLDGFQPCQSFTLIHEHFHKSFSNPVCSIILFSWAFWVKPVFSHSGECAFVSCKWD